MYKDIYIIDLNYRRLLEKCGTSHKRLSKIISAVPFKYEIDDGDIQTDRCYLDIPDTVYHKMKEIAEIPSSDEIWGSNIYIMCSNVLLLHLADLCGMTYDIDIRFIHTLWHKFYAILSDNNDKEDLSINDRIALFIVMTKFYEKCYQIRDRLLSANKKSLELSHFRRMYNHLMEIHPVDNDGENEITFIVGCFISISIQYEVLSRMDVKIEPIEDQSMTILMRKVKKILESKDAQPFDEVCDILNKCIDTIDKIMFRN